MRKAFMSTLYLGALLLAAACAPQPPSAASVAALTAEFAAPRVAVDTDCIFSAPVRGEFIAHRLFGWCLFSDSQLRLYYGGERPQLAFAWALTSLKAYALHEDTFTLVTTAGNFGLVLKDRAAFRAALQQAGGVEDPALPLFRAKDPSPFNWM